MRYNQLNTEKFIEKAKTIHGDKYDYSKVEYLNNHTKICIICPIHGEFWQTPMKHLAKRGCPKCGTINRVLHKTSTTSKFIEKAKIIYGDKYDYSKVEYKSSSQKVCIICPKHGEFYITPNNHLRGHGCTKCQYETLHNLFTSNTEEFIKKARKIHGAKYDYSKTIYKSSNKEVRIICSTHGEFWQTPDNHLQSKGCPKCFQSKLENEIAKLLDENNIEYKQYVTSKEISFIGRQHLDFFLPKYNIAIECQGIQHFKPIDFAKRGKKWAEEQFQLTIKRDKEKLEKCVNNNIKLLYYSNLDINYPYKVFEDKELLINEIRGTNG